MNISQLTLTELVRLLEQRGHLFPQDPSAITAQLRQTDGDLTDKLHRRATLIDRDHAIADRLQHHQRRIHGLFYAMLVVWAVMGFVATYGLMQQSAVNFFVLLMGVLGLNTIMLLVWLVNIIFYRQPLKLSPTIFQWNKTDPIQQVIWQLPTESHHLRHTIWQHSVRIHQLALTGLGGMFAAALLLLLVRQYRFTWESTLLSHDTFMKMVAYLSWLPEKLGFDVPQAAAILASRNQLDTHHAAAWGSLLLGSLLCYGVLPRLLAWAMSVWQMRRYPMKLNLQLPYYQNITQKWQRKIIDSDADYRPDQVKMRPAPAVSIAQNSAYWAIALESAPAREYWYQGVLGQDWLNKGVLASRDEWAALNEEIAQQSVQLLLAIRATQTPDRGIIRRLANISVPIVLCFWTPASSNQAVHDTLAQWHDIAEQYGWTWVDDIQAA